MKLIYNWSHVLPFRGYQSSLSRHYQQQQIQSYAQNIPELPRHTTLLLPNISACLKVSDPFHSRQLLRRAHVEACLTLTLKPGMSIDLVSEPDCVKILVPEFAGLQWHDTGSLAWWYRVCCTCKGHELLFWVTWAAYRVQTTRLSVIRQKDGRRN